MEIQNSKCKIYPENRFAAAADGIISFHYSSVIGCFTVNIWLDVFMNTGFDLLFRTSHFPLHLFPSDDSTEREFQDHSTCGLIVT